MHTAPDRAAARTGQARDGAGRGLCSWVPVTLQPQTVFWWLRDTCRRKAGGGDGLRGAVRETAAWGPPGAESGPSGCDTDTAPAVLSPTARQTDCRHTPRGETGTHSGSAWQRRDHAVASQHDQVSGPGATSEPPQPKGGTWQQTQGPAVTQQVCPRAVQQHHAEAVPPGTRRLRGRWPGPSPRDQGGWQPDARGYSGHTSTQRLGGLAQPSVRPREPAPACEPPPTGRGLPRCPQVAPRPASPHTPGPSQRRTQLGPEEPLGGWPSATRRRGRLEGDSGRKPQPGRSQPRVEETGSGRAVPCCLPDVFRAFQKAVYPQPPCKTREDRRAGTVTLCARGVPSRERLGDQPVCRSPGTAAPLPPPPSSGPAALCTRSPGEGGCRPGACR